MIVRTSDKGFDPTSCKVLSLWITYHTILGAFPSVRCRSTSDRRSRVGQHSSTIADTRNSRPAAGPSHWETHSVDGPVGWRFHLHASLHVHIKVHDSGVLSGGITINIANCGKLIGAMSEQLKLLFPVLFNFFFFFLTKSFPDAAPKLLAGVQASSFSATAG